MSESTSLKKNFLEHYQHYIEDILHDHNNYTGLSVHGVRFVAKETECVVDDVNPEFFSVYLRHQDGTTEVIADASFSRVTELRDLANVIAAQYDLKCEDFTLQNVNKGLRIVVVLDDGMVLSVHSGSDIPVSVAIQDLNIDHADADEIAILNDGTEFLGSVQQTVYDPCLVNSVFSAFE